MTLRDLIFAWLTLCSLASVANWRRYGAWRARPVTPRSVIPARAPRFSLGQTWIATEVLDVRTEVLGLLHEAEPVAARRSVQLEIALQPRLQVCADRRVLHEAIGDVLACAIRQAGCKRVLVGAMRHGGRVQISVTDDGPGCSDAACQGELQNTARLLTLLGGTLHIDARPNEGCIVAVHLPEPGAAPTGGPQDAPVSASQRHA